VNFVSGKKNFLSEEIFVELGQYRHRVFVEMLGWNLICPAGNEVDQFDGPDTIYVIGWDARGNIGAAARLLPTDRPYLLREIFPQLMAGFPLPNSSRVWELSRFAAVDLTGGVGRAAGQFSSRQAIGLMNEVLGVAAKHQVERLITVSPAGMERLLDRAGFEAYPAFPPIDVEGESLFACWIDVCGRPSTVRRSTLASKEISRRQMLIVR